MIEDVEDFCAKLDVESFRDALDVVVFEHGEVQRRQTWTCDDVAAGITAQVEASQISRRKRPPKTRWCWITVSVKECLIWRYGYLEALRLYVLEVSRPRKRLATGTA